MHGGMEWYPASVPVRADPWKEWPWARSVLVVRIPYALPRPEPRGERPVVAGYARGVDYHERAGALLRAACGRLEEAFPGLRTRWFCDALPVQEVELAVLAGLGWRGRNGLLIDQRAGSAFHLGGILLSLEGVAAPERRPDRCGSCSACVEACPSRAILPDGVVDASRCLSQWNIESRGTPEGPAAEAVRGEIAGCDICQQACPWNRKVMTESVTPEGWPGSWEEWVELCMPRAGFQGLFRRTPLDRPGRAKILRVLLRALWNADRDRARPLLRAAAFAEDRPAIRGWARALLGADDPSGEPGDAQDGRGRLLDAQPSGVQAQVVEPGVGPVAS